MVYSTLLNHPVLLYQSKSRNQPPLWKNLKKIWGRKVWMITPILPVYSTKNEGEKIVEKLA
jgi:hypothetical protein